MFAALACSACNDTQVVHTPIANIQGDWIFAVKVSQLNQSTTLVHTEARTVQEKSSNALLRFEIQPEQESAFLIGINQADILAQVANHDPARINKIQIRLRSDEQAPSKDFVVIEIPETSHYYQFEVDNKRFESISAERMKSVKQAVELLVPIDLDHCRREDREELQVFPQLNPELCTRTYYRLYDVDENRFVAVTQVAAHLYYRNQENDCAVLTSTANYRQVANFSRADRDVALGKTPLPGHSENNYLVAAVSEEFDRPDSESNKILTGYRIETTKLTPDGFDIPTIVARFDLNYFASNLSNTCAFGAAENTAEVEDIIIDSENRIVIVFDDGSILTRSYGETNFSYYAICDYARYATDWLLDISHVNARPEGQYPYLVGTDGNDGFAYLFDPDKPEEEPQKAYVEPSQELDLIASAYDSFASPARFMVVANSKTEGIILEQDPQESGFSEWEVTYSERFNPCLSPSGRLIEYETLSLDSRAIYTVPRCNAVVRIRRSDRCAMLLKVPDFTGFDPDYEGLRSLIIRGDQLIVGAENGRLYTFDLQGIDQSK